MTLDTFSEQFVYASYYYNFGVVICRVFRFSLSWALFVLFVKMNLNFVMIAKLSRFFYLYFLFFLFLFFCFFPCFSTRAATRKRVHILVVAHLCTNIYRKWTWHLWTFYLVIIVLNLSFETLCLSGSLLCAISISSIPLEKQGCFSVAVLLVWALVWFKV